MYNTNIVFPRKNRKIFHLFLNLAEAHGVYLSKPGITCLKVTYQYIEGDNLIRIKRRNLHNFLETIVEVYINQNNLINQINQNNLIYKCKKIELLNTKKKTISLCFITQKKSKP